LSFLIRQLPGEESQGLRIALFGDISPDKPAYRQAGRDHYEKNNSFA